MTELFNWLTDTPPAWANELIKNWESEFCQSGAVPIRDFVTREVIELRSEIDMREVVGQRDHYAGQTWLEATKKPQWKEWKMKDSFRLNQENPDYYFNGQVAGGMRFTSLNDGPWYSDEGNHRTVVSKFACDRIHQQTGVYPRVQGVTKQKFFANLEAWSLMQRLHGLADGGIHVTFERTERRIETSNGYQSDFELHFFVGDHRFNRDGRYGHLGEMEFVKYARHILGTAGAVTRIDRARHYWRYWFGKMDNLIY